MTRLKLVMIFVLLSVSAAWASPSCLTLHQARAKYPDSYLSWRGDHCWYNGERARRHHRHRHRDPEPETRDAAPPPAPAPMAAPVPLPMSRPAPPPAPSSADVGTSTPDLAPEAQFQNRWPAQVLQAVYRTPDPPQLELAPPAGNSTATAYVIVLLILLIALGGAVFGEEIVLKLVQRPTLFDNRSPFDVRIL